MVLAGVGNLAMTLGFLAVSVWAFRPGSRAMHQDVATSIFRNDDRPAEDPAQHRKEA